MWGFMKMAQAGLFRRFGPWLLLAAASAAYYPRFLKDIWGGIVWDYSNGAACLLRHAVLQDCQPTFTYPPFFALVMIPFVLMPVWLRDLVWYVVTIGAFVGSFKISEMLGLRFIADPLDANETVWVRGLALLLSSRFVLAVLESQAYDGLVLIFVLLGAAALAAGRQVSGGISLAIATALKATPFIFLPYLLLKRRFAAAAAFVPTLFAASYLPDVFFTPEGGRLGYFNTWLREVAGAGLTDDPSIAKRVFWTAGFANHSLRGAVTMLFNGSSQSSLDGLVLAVDLAFIVAVGILVLRTPRDNRFIAVDTSILVIAMLMLSPMTSRSHYVALILPYTVLLMAWMRNHETRVVGTVVLITSFVLATATSNDLVGESITNWAYGHSFPVLGASVLLVYLAVISGNANRQLQVLPQMAKGI